MKFTLSLLAAALGLVSAAPSAPKFVTRAATSCPASVLSCHTSGTVNTCCSPKYGLLVLDLQWAPGWGPSDAFTIHGLWPDTCSGSQLSSSGCDSSRSYSDIATIISNADSALYDKMNTYWPSNTGDNNKFWSHEWTKHGTCVTTLNPTCYGSSYVQYEDVTDYFKTVLGLRDQYDIYSALSSAGITPGNNYDTEDIRSAIAQAYGSQTKLDCSSGTLTDVSINFYVQGTSNYQVTDVSNSGSCSGSIYYAPK